MTGNDATLGAFRASQLMEGTNAFIFIWLCVCVCLCVCSPPGQQEALFSRTSSSTSLLSSSPPPPPLLLSPSSSSSSSPPLLFLLLSSVFAFSIWELGLLSVACLDSSPDGNCRFAQRWIQEQTFTQPERNCKHSAGTGGRRQRRKKLL